MQNIKEKSMLILSALLYGFGFLASQFALDAGWLPFSLLSARGIIAGSILLGISFRYKVKWYTNKKLVGYILMAGVVMFLGFVIQLYGQMYSNISIASIMTGLYVLFTPFLASIFKKQNLGFKTYLACTIAFISIVVISYDGSSFKIGLGEILLIVSAIIYSFHFLMMETLASHQIAFAISGVQLLVMGVLSGIGAIITNQSYVSVGIESVLFLALGSSGVAFLLQTFGQEKVNSSVSSMLLSFESVFGVIAAILIYQDPYNWQIIVGCILMFMAIVVLEMRGKKDGNH